MKALIATGLSIFMSCAAAADQQPTDAQVDAAFKKADPNGDGKVSRAEASRFGISKKAFDHANPDKDGQLDKTEFLNAVSYQFAHHDPDKDSTLDRKEAGKSGLKNKDFTAADPDKDGTLDLAEYLSALTAKAK